MNTELENLVSTYRKLGIDRQIDYDKFYLYSIITHSTAIEGSTITEVENQIMFDHGISLKGKSIEEQNMNLDLKAAYERSIQLAAEHAPVTVDMLRELSALVMKNTGKEYKTALGDFSSARGELRLLNVTAGIGGRSYMNYNKVPAKLAEFCTRLNDERANCGGKSIYDLYILSFDAHYNLVTIHPWADGNGRMARLLMNQLQFEFGLIPTKILNEDKEEYIKSLVATRENDDLNIFRDFMVSAMVKNLVHDIEAYRNSIDDNEIKAVKEQIDREVIIPVDMEDNGEKVSNHTFSFIPKFLPSWMEVPNYDDAFCRVEAIVFDILKEIVKDKVVQVATKKELQKRYDCINDGILEIPAQTMPWLEDVVNYNQTHNYNVKFVIFPYPAGGWAAQSVPPSIEKKFEQLVSFPKEWAGGNEQTLPVISGIQDATFCHNGCFFARAKTKESVLEMCRIAMN